jgi:hypothetical protein
MHSIMPFQSTSVGVQVPGVQHTVEVAGCCDSSSYVRGTLNKDKLEALSKRLPGSYVNGSNQDSIMSKLTSHASLAMCEIKAFLLHSMIHLLRHKPEHDHATDKQRRALLLRLFNQAQCTISFLMFENQSVRLNNMFVPRTPSALRGRHERRQGGQESCKGPIEHVLEEVSSLHDPPTRRQNFYRGRVLGANQKAQKRSRQCLRAPRW